MNIKADSTIVASAGALARAKVPFSMQGMTDNLLKERGELLDSISTNFEKSMQEIEGVNAEAKEAMEKLAKNINDGTINNSDERAEMQDQLEIYREELKNIPLFGKENKRRRADLLYEINKYTKTKQTDNQIGNDIVTSYNTSAYDVGLTGAPSIAFVKNFADYYNGDATDSSFKVEDINGKRVYSFTYTDGSGKTTSFERQSIEDVSKRLRKRDTGAITSVNTILNDARKSAKNNTKLEKQDVLQEIENNIEALFKNNPDGFASVARTKMFGQSTSYYDALHNPDSDESKQILDVLLSMKPALDENNDNRITKADFATEENYEEFIKSLTDPNPQERALAHSLAAKFYADEEGGRAIDLGIKYRADEKKTGSGGDGGGNNWGGWGRDSWNTGGGFVGGKERPGKYQTHADASIKRNQLDNLQTVRGAHGIFTWNPEAGDNGMYEAEGDQFTVGEVAGIEGILRDGETEDSAIFKPTSTQVEQATVDQAALQGIVTGDRLTKDGKISVSAAVNNLNSFYFPAPNSPIKFSKPGGWFNVTESFAWNLPENTATLKDPNGKNITPGNLGMTVKQIVKLAEKQGLISRSTGEVSGTNVYAAEDVLWFNFNNDFDEQAKFISELFKVSPTLNKYREDKITREKRNAEGAEFD
tara:strand:+ start:14286 stop:16229 length:1944 start_codon:yes stop_codon:yes gene_type:complete